MTHHKRHRRTLRGYLLMETMLGGAMAAVIILGLLTSLAQSRNMSIATGRDVTASQLVMEKIDERRSRGFSASPINDPGSTTENTIAGVTGNYVRVTTVSAIANEVVTMPSGAVNKPYKDVTVTVTYTTTKDASWGKTGRTRTSQATARVYQP